MQIKIEVNGRQIGLVQIVNVDVGGFGGDCLYEINGYRWHKDKMDVFAGNVRHKRDDGAFVLAEKVFREMNKKIGRDSNGKEKTD